MAFGFNLWRKLSLEKFECLSRIFLSEVKEIGILLAIGFGWLHTTQLLREVRDTQVFCLHC